MSIYVMRKNQQAGPFEETKVLEMLGSGELSPDDLAIRRGEQKWQNLSAYFPNAGNAAPPADVVTAPSASKKSRKGLLFGFGVFFLVVLLTGGVLGVLAVRNLYPSPDNEDLPETVKIGDSGEFKLKSRERGSGNIRGTEKFFAGVYINKDFPNDNEKNIISLLSVYADEKAAKEALENELQKSCKKGEKPIYFLFVDSNMKETGASAATCAYPLYVLKDNKLYSLGGPGVNVANWIAFAENLPFNQGSRMMSKPDIPINQPQTFPDPNPEKKADFQVNANDFYKEALKSENREAGIAKYKGKVVEISGRVASPDASNRKELRLGTEESSWVYLELGASQADKPQNIKEYERVRAKCDASVDIYQIELMDCIILERKPAVMLDETPDITVPAKEFYEQAEDYENRKKYIGKIIDITGEVYKIGDDKNYFKVGEQYLSCGNDKELMGQFYILKEGQKAVFRATYDGIALRRCILVRWF